MNIGQEYLRVVRARFLDMKKTAERAMDQCSEEQLFLRTLVHSPFGGLFHVKKACAHHSQIFLADVHSHTSVKEMTSLLFAVDAVISFYVTAKSKKSNALGGHDYGSCFRSRRVNN